MKLRAKQILNLFVVIYVTASSALAEDAVDKYQNVVGDLADIHFLHFAGNNSFSDKALRKALWGDVRFLSACQASAPLNIYLRQIGESLLAGYVASGFPEAKVNVSVSDHASNVLVQISEGIRYTAGIVQVDGAVTIPAQVLRNALVTDPRGDVVLTTSDSGRTGEEWLDDFRCRFMLGGPLWQEGFPVNFSEETKSMLQGFVIQTLFNLGYPSATVRTEIVKRGNTANLHIRVENEGPLASIARVEVTGNSINSTEQIVETIGLASRQGASFVPLNTICKRLWRSSRFSSFSAVLREIPGHQDSYVLHIEVKETPGLPSLSKENQRLTDTLARSSEWLDSYLQNGGHIMVAGTFKDGLDVPAILKESTLKIVLSSSGAELMLQYKTGTNAVCSLGFDLEADRFVMFSDALQQKYELVARRSWTPIFKFKLLPQGTNANMSVDYQVSSIPDDGHKPPSFAQLAISPTTLLLLASRNNVTNSFDHGVLTVSSYESVLKFDESTGQLLQITSTSTNGVFNITFADEPSRHLFDETKRRIENYRNICVPDDRISSFFEMLSDIIFKEPKVAGATLPEMPEELKVRRSNAIEHYWKQKPFAGFDSLFSNNQILITNQQEAFNIPPDFQATVSDPLQSVFTSLVKLICSQYATGIEDTYPTGAWPASLFRGVALIGASNISQSNLNIETLYDSPQIGPLGCLAATFLLIPFQNGQSARFAFQGLQHLQTSDFDRDCELLLTKDSKEESLVLTMLQAFGHLSLEDRKVLVEACDKRYQTEILQIGNVFETTNLVSSRDALLQALNLIWETNLRESVDDTLCDTLNMYDPALVATKGIHLPRIA